MTAARPAVRWGATVGATVAGALVVVLAASAASADGRRGVVVFGIAGVLLLIAGLVFGSGVYPAGLVAIGVSFAFSLAGHQVGSVEVITATALLLLVDQLAAWAFDAATGAVERGRAISGRCLRVVAIVLIGAAVERAGPVCRGSPCARRTRGGSDRHRRCSRCARACRVAALGALGARGSHGAPCRHIVRSDEITASRRARRSLDRLEGVRHQSRAGRDDHRVRVRSAGGRVAEGVARAARRVRCSTPRSRRSTGRSRKPGAVRPTTWRWRASSRKYLEDVYSADPVPREALTDECEILVVGAGFAGLLLWHKLTRGRASSTSGSARRAATSAARGTGTAIRASPVTSSRTATSRCSRRWATSRR